MEDKELRSRILSLRDSLSNETRAAAAAAVAQRLAALPQWQQAKDVMLFVSFRSEIDTRALIELAWSSGKLVAVPRCHPEDRRLEAHRIKSWADLVNSNYGILEPPDCPATKVEPTALDFILIPGSVFDRTGNRMGYGAGFYDRFLLRCRANAPRVAIAYDFQIVEKLQPKPHDQTIDYLLTDSAFYSFFGVNGREQV
ncbi:MAG: 5-formyltetrahydrofolate cyclo-ligase [Negativicutes bacterium]|nr:5-formyltetrahydrofolate cyclo-ligase [Negativicutes bacterium]